VYAVRTLLFIAHGVPVNQLLVEMCQQHLIAALQARIHATEHVIGQRFGFEVVQYDHATAFFAHRWPHTSHNLPFHRIFHYRAPSSAGADPLLDRLVDERIDAIIEVVPGAHLEATATLLHTYGFHPVWHIPWFHLPLGDVESASPSIELIRKVAPSEFAQFAAVLCAAYGYVGSEREAWHPFAQYGYRAPGFVCFIASVDQHTAAAGVLHLNHTSALVDGAATLPAYRGRGLQKALLASRLWHAKQHGATHAFSRTGAGSISQANLEKIGMRILVHSTAWRRT
jgi:GNAT superfamily N-acetyltransferase